MYIKRKLLEERQGITLARALEIAENCEKVDTQLAAMTIEENGENSVSVNRIEGTKIGHGKRNQSRGTKTGRKKTCYRSRFQLSSKRSILSSIWAGRKFSRALKTKQKGEEKQKQTKGHRNLREVLQIWLVATTKKRNQCMLLR